MREAGPSPPPTPGGCTWAPWASEKRRTGPGGGKLPQAAFALLGQGEFVPDPESSSSLPTPRPVVVGLLLAISQRAALAKLVQLFPSQAGL